MYLFLYQLRRRRFYYVKAAKPNRKMENNKIFELGVYTFGNTPRTESGSYRATAQAIRNILEAVKLAEEVGLDYFGFGEHHSFWSFQIVVVETARPDAAASIVMDEGTDTFADFILSREYSTAALGFPA